MVPNSFELIVSQRNEMASCICELSDYDLPVQTKPDDIYERMNVFYSNTPFVEYGSNLEDVQITIRVGNDSLIKKGCDFVPYIRNELYLNASSIGMLNTLENMMLLL